MMMKNICGAIATSTLLLASAVFTSPAAVAEGYHYLPVVNLYHASCLLPRREILDGDDVVGFETTRVAKCPGVLEPRQEEDTYRAYASASRVRPGNAGTGPNVNFSSEDYEDLPCLIIDSYGGYLLSYDWKTSITPTANGTKHNITCWVAEEVEEEVLQKMRILEVE